MQFYVWTHVILHASNYKMKTWNADLTTQKYLINVNFAGFCYESSFQMFSNNA